MVKTAVVSLWFHDGDNNNDDGFGGDKANSAPFTLLNPFEYVLALIFLTAKGDRSYYFSKNGKLNLGACNQCGLFLHGSSNRATVRVKALQGILKSGSMLIESKELQASEKSYPPHLADHLLPSFSLIKWKQTAKHLQGICLGSVAAEKRVGIETWKRDKKLCLNQLK